jgi:hypothetical protein
MNWELGLRESSVSTLAYWQRIKESNSTLDIAAINSSLCGARGIDVSDYEDVW